jgi:hypothetical protein
MTQVVRSALFGFLSPITKRLDKKHYKEWSDILAMLSLVVSGTTVQTL